jgi:hypothetical protein
MKRFIPLASLIIIGFMATAVSAATYSIPPIPDWPETSWDAGKAVTYDAAIDHGEDRLTFNLRIAVLGTEPEGTEMLYWVEMDMTDVRGIPQDLQDLLYANYGQAPNALRMKLLIPKYDFMRMWTDPSGVYHDLTEPGFIRAMVFQYNRLVPYDVDPSLIGALLIPLVTSQLIDDLPDDFISERNLGIHMIEDPESWNTDLSESETTVEGGTFDGWLWTYSNADGEGAATTVFFAEDLPVLPLVSMDINWNTENGLANGSLELLQLEESGAQTDIVGEPVRFDLTTF